MYSTLLNHVLLPAAVAASRSSYLRIARETENRQRWSLDEISQWQLCRLRELVGFAIENVAFYRSNLGRTQSSNSPENLDDFAQFPVVVKRDIEANFPDRIVSEKLLREDTRTYGTRGTTHRIVVINDFEKRDWIRAGEMFTMISDCGYRLGRRATFIPPDACSTLCGIEGARETSVVKQLLNMAVRRQFRDGEARSDLRGLVMNNWIYCRSVLEPFGNAGTHIPEQRLAEYISLLRSKRPYFLKALPEYLQMLARYIKRTGDRPHKIPVVKPMGALMTPTMKREVAEAFGVPVREDYGSSDVGPMGFDCRQMNGLHLLSDHYYFEFLRGGRPAADGELALLVVTDLHNRAMPLIRYQVGDVVRVDRTPCPCGRNTPRITVEGRIQDTIVTPRGRVLTARMLYEFFFGHPGIDQFQLIERSARRFELNYVPSGDPVDHRELADRFQEFSGDDRPLVAREVDTILPESSGKFRHVISRSFDRFSDSGDAATGASYANESQPYVGDRSD